MPARTIAPEGAIAVEGLSEAMRGLGKVSREARRDSVRALRELAKDPVVARARIYWGLQRIKPTQANRAVKWSATSTGAAAVLKYSTHPYAAGVEFGSYQFRQFRRWRGNRFTVTPGSSTGYVVQDAIRDTLPEVERRAADDMVKAIDRYLPK